MYEYEYEYYENGVEYMTDRPPFESLSLSLGRLVPKFGSRLITYLPT